MSEDVNRALARTALLLERDAFVGADHQRIIDGLRATTARIIASRSNLDSVAGQTALVTLYGQLAMMGLQVDLDVPSIGLLVDQPPLRGEDIGGALVDYSDDLMPGGSSQPATTPDVTFALGDTCAPRGAIRVSGSAWRANVTQDRQGDRWRGSMTVGAMAAAAAAAADGLRVAMPRIAEHVEWHVPVDSAFVLGSARSISLDLTAFSVSGPVRLGKVDLISGGAITSSALYALRRIPQLTAQMRVFEADTLDLPNLNRYPVARRSQVGMAKVNMLTMLTVDGFDVVGIPTRFDGSTVPSFGELAPRILVGVDHIPSRWSVQNAARDSWLSVGATSHFYVLVSAHPAGLPCAGCVHPKDDAVGGDTPTIAFVSLWAGLLQALELIQHATGKAKVAATATNIWPIGLEGRYGIQRTTQAPVKGCPVGCRASRSHQPKPW